LEGCRLNYPEKSHCEYYKNNMDVKTMAEENKKDVGLCANCKHYADDIPKRLQLVSLPSIDYSKYGYCKKREFLVKTINECITFEKLTKCPYDNLKGEEKTAVPIGLRNLSKKSIKEEIEEQERLIREELKRREEVIDKIKDLLYRDSNFYKYKNGYTFKKEFIEFLKDVGDSFKELRLSSTTNKRLKRFHKKVKLVKKIHYGGYIGDYVFRFCGKDVLELPKEDWEIFEMVANYILAHKDKFLLDKRKKQLCELTDCYKKLKTKECKSCGNELRKGSIYCDQCGNKNESWSDFTPISRV